MKWLSVVGETVLSLAHSAGGAERNWSTHNNIFSDRRQSQLPSTLERNVRMFCDMRLRDHVLGRGRQAKKDKEKQVKYYPLHKGDWSSCDESEDAAGASSASVAMAF